MTDTPPDALGYRLKVGVIMPSTNTIVQPETDAARLPGVTYHVGRIPISDRKIDMENFLEHVEAMRAGIETATDQVKSAGIDSLIMAVALEAFWGGVQQSEALKAKLAAYAGVPVILGSDAVAAALRAFGAKSVAILTPHMPRGDEEVRNWMEDSGFSVKRLTGLKCQSPRAIAQVPQGRIHEALLALDGDDIDALVQVGTNLAGAQVAIDTEKAIGKPVISINTVSAWAALRQAGVLDRIEGRGRVFEEF